MNKGKLALRGAPCARFLAAAAAALSFCATTVRAESTDSNGNKMNMFLFGSAAVCYDSGGNKMFLSAAGPLFADGLDNASNLAQPFSTDSFVVPVTCSSFSVE